MEIWKNINGYNYSVSNYGRVKYLGGMQTINGRWGEFTRIKKENILTPWSKHHGYKCVYLDNRKVKMVHRLVAEAFLGLDPNNTKIEVGHKDNNPSNNNLDNLYLTNHKENEEYKVLHGRTLKGEKATNVKLKEKDIIDIYKKYKSGETISSLEKEYSHKGIGDIIRGRNWKHLYSNF